MSITRTVCILTLALGGSAGPAVRVTVADAPSAQSPVGPRPAPPLPPPRGDVVRVATVEELRAAVDRLKSGQTILIAPGVYRLTRSLPIRGADDVVIRGEGGDRDAVVLDFAAHTGDEGVRFHQCNRVMLADLTVQNVTANGIKINGSDGASHVTIRNVHGRNVWQRHVKGTRVLTGPDGTITHTPGHRIEFCLFENDRPKRVGDDPYEDRNRDEFQHNYIGGIDMMATDGLVVADNVFRGIQGKSREGRAAVFLWSNSKNGVVERNLVVDCDMGIALGNPSGHQNPTPHATGFVVRNNFLVRCPEGELFASYTKDCAFLHNTVHHPDSPRQRLFRVFPANDGLEVAGNIFSGPTIPADHLPGLAPLRGNLNRDMTKSFRDVAAGDLHLVATATDAIDRGTADPRVQDDIDAASRKDPPDLGADEFGRD
jgi:hypothetical protein